MTEDVCLQICLESESTERQDLAKECDKIAQAESVMDRDAQGGGLVAFRAFWFSSWTEISSIDPHGTVKRQSLDT
jgi:hypothetical protein